MDGPVHPPHASCKSIQQLGAGVLELEEGAVWMAEGEDVCVLKGHGEVERVR